MKRIACVVAACLFALLLCPSSWHQPAFAAETLPAQSLEIDNFVRTLVLFSDGKQIFRFDTFGSETFWGDTLKLHQAVAGSANGGIGPGLSPREALRLGLRIDLHALPDSVIDALAKGTLDLDDPANTIALLKSNAVIGLTGFFNSQGRLQSIGIQCALCHTTSDDVFAPGIGNRRDGWANRDLNVGAIIAFAPDLSAFATLFGVDQATVRAILNSWGPGRFDAALFMDGKAFRPDGKTSASLIPPIFALAGSNLHTRTGWGSVPYWNSFVAVLLMQGKGTHYDPRLNDAAQFPVAARAGFGNVRNSPDLVTEKLPALHIYQLSIQVPIPPVGTFDPEAAARGQIVFNGKARCATCHVPTVFMEPGWSLHTAAEIGIDDFQSSRSPDKRYRTAPLKGLWTHTKGGFFHDGRFATLRDVIGHFNTLMGLGLTEAETSDLINYLMSL